jgi:hypothetical protein
VNRRSFLWYPVAMICATAAVASDQHAVMRWDSSCIHLTEKSYAEAPMKDGEPDFAETKLHGMKLDRACGVIRVERAQ